MSYQVCDFELFHLKQFFNSCSSECAISVKLWKENPNECNVVLQALKCKFIYIFFMLRIKWMASIPYWWWTYEMLIFTDRNWINFYFEWFCTLHVCCIQQMTTTRNTKFELIEFVKCKWTNWRQLICNFLIDTWYTTASPIPNEPNLQLKLFEFDSHSHSNGSILLTRANENIFIDMCESENTTQNACVLTWKHNGKWFAEGYPKRGIILIETQEEIRRSTMHHTPNPSIFQININLFKQNFSLKTKHCMKMRKIKPK